MVLTGVVIRSGALGGLEPPASVLTTVMSYVVRGASGPVATLAAAPVTVVVTSAAVDPTGVKVTVEEVISAAAVGSAAQEICHSPPDSTALTAVGAAGGVTSRYAWPSAL